MKTTRGPPRSLSWHGQQWDPIFDRERVIPEALQDDQIISGPIELLLGDKNNLRTLQKFKELADFCENVTLKDLDEAVGSHPTAEYMMRRASWLHDTCSTTGKQREYDQALSVLQLRHHLNLKRFGHGLLPNADRRLLRIMDLDAWIALVLAETAYQHQLPAVRYVLWGHITHHSCLKAEINALGYRIFQLHVQIPYHALRPGGLLGKTPNFRRSLDIQSIIFRPSLIHQGQISLTIFGTDVKRWMALLIMDAYFNGGGDGAEEDQEERTRTARFETGNNDHNKDAEEHEDKDEEADGKASNSVPSDQITARDSDPMIWDPRRHFLKAVRTRLSQVHSEERSIVRALKEGIDDAKRTYPCLVSALEPNSQQQQHLENALQWAISILGLLNRLHNNMGDVIGAWTTFSTERGDINVFEDILSDPTSRGFRYRGLMSEIRAEYIAFANLQRTLKSMMNECGGYKDRAESHRRAIQLQLALEHSNALKESCNATKESFGIARFTLYAISPLALATAMVDTPMMSSFGKSPKTLVVLVMIIGAALQAILLLPTVLRVTCRWWTAFTSVRECTLPIEEFGSETVTQRGDTGLTLMETGPRIPLRTWRWQRKATDSKV